MDAPTTHSPAEEARDERGTTPLRTAEVAEPSTPAELRAAAATWAGITRGWPRVFAVKSLFGNARFVGEVIVERHERTITVSGKRVGYWPYWLRYWLIAAIVGLLTLPPVQQSGVPIIVNLLAVLALVTFGGRLVLVGTARRESVSFMLTHASGASVGLRIRGWHLLLIGFSGLAALVVFALYRGGRRTVSVEGDRGDGNVVRYLFLARDERQAIMLGALFLP